MRAFIALDPSLPVRERLDELIRALASRRSGVKWCKPDQIHVTLKFFGDLPDAAIQPVIAAVSDACAAFPPFPVTVRGAGSFGPRGAIRVVWAGVEELTGALGGLQRAIDEKLGPLGFPPEARAFHPHLTLGRLRDPARDPALSQALQERGDFDGGRFLADRLALYSSVLSPAGPTYSVVHTWPLEVKS